MQRVLIIGCCGSGKTTLALQLARLTGLPLVHLDREYWQPGWVEPSKAAWQAKVAELISRPRWLIDGNYGGTLPMRLQAADTVILLDFPRRLCLWRVLKRVLRSHGVPRAHMACGCPERFDLRFLLYIWRFNRVTRPAVYSALEAFAGKRIVLRHPRDVGVFLGESRFAIH